MIFTQKKLRSLREQKGLTQALVAKQLGTTPTAISRLEKGVHHAGIHTIEWYLEVVGYRLTITEVKNAKD